VTCFLPAPVLGWYVCAAQYQEKREKSSLFNRISIANTFGCFIFLYILKQNKTREKNVVSI
jgi:hypothetical protein